MKKLKLKTGAIALISMLTVAALILILATSTISLSINQTQLTLTDRQRTDSQAIAYACLEETALQIKNNPNYSGGTFTLAGGTCTVTIVANAQNREATINATLNQHTSSLQAIFSIIVNGQTTKISLISVDEV